MAFSGFLTAQVPSSLKDIQTEETYDNIFVMKLNSDSLQSSFIIWIKREVKLHKHEWHSENVIIIEGKGELKIGDTTYTVSAGDYVNIPAGTPHSVKVTSKRPMKVLSVQSPQFLGDDRVILE
jgi:quercetin dioxygenase-like cupin family protein